MSVERYIQSSLPLPDLSPSFSQAIKTEHVLQGGKEFYLPPPEQQSLVTPISEEEFVQAAMDTNVDIIATIIADFEEKEVKAIDGINTLITKNNKGELIPNPFPKVKKQEFVGQNHIAAARKIREHHPNDPTSSDLLSNTYNKVMHEREVKREKPKRKRHSIFHPVFQTSSQSHPRK